MTQSPPLVVGIGEVLWDMLPAGKQLGGAPANFAYHAQALGAQAICASCVGEDELGREVLSRLAALGMDGQFIAVDPAHPTGTVDVQVDEKGVPAFTIHQEVAWDFIPLSDDLLALAQQADVVCFGSLAQRWPVSRQTIRRFLAATPGQCLRVFDINLRQSYFDRQVIHESLELADVLKLNDQELGVLASLFEVGGDDEFATIGHLMSNYPLQLIALTQGGSGSRLYRSGRYFDHPGYPAQVVDTVGAGDAFTAALAMGLHQGLDPDAINDRANRLGSYVCSQAGGTPPVPSDLFSA